MKINNISIYHAVTYLTQGCYSLFTQVIKQYPIKQYRVCPLVVTGIVRIICLSLRVCPSVRPFVCNAYLVRAISPRTFRAKKLQKNPKIIYLLKLCNKKSKFNFAKNFGSFGQKNTFWICVLSRPDLGNYKR